MNYEFDFNIYNYTISELQKFLNLEQDFTFNDISEKCSKMNSIIIENKDYDKVYKTRLGKFLEEAKLKLIKHIKEISQEDDGFIEDYDKPVIDNKFTSANFQKPIEQNDNVSRIINPMATSHQSLQKNKIPSNSVNPYGGKKFVANYVFNTQFRDNFFSTNPEDCTFTLPVKLKNVIEISLSAIQIPNVMLAFGNSEGSNRIFIQEEGTGLEGIVIIPVGNYSINDFPSVLEEAINNQILGSYPNRFKVSINPHTYYTTISNTTYNFNMNLLTDITINIANCKLAKYYINSNPDNPVKKNNINIQVSDFVSTMGYLIGYRQVTYFDSNSYTSESMFNGTFTDYVYFCMNDYVGAQYMQNYGVLPTCLIDENVLAVVPITTPKFVSTFADNSDYIYKTRNYIGPVDIQKISIKLLNPQGSIVDVHKYDYGFNLQVISIYDNTMAFEPIYTVSGL